jgi:hypothetical protein
MMPKPKSDQFPLSHSQMTTFRQCPEKWWLIYQENQPYPSSPALDFGKDLHAVLAQCVLPENHNRWEDVVADMWGAYKEYGRNAYTLPMVSQMVRSALGTLDSIGVAEVLGVELDLRLPMFRGFIDLRFRDTQDKVWIWDWKTSSSGYTTDAIRNHSQLSAYGYLHKEEYGEYPDYYGLGVIHKTKLECTGYRAIRTAEEIEAWYEDMVNTHRRIWKRGDRWKDDQRCNDYFTQCPFFEHCWGSSEVMLIDSTSFQF